MMITGSAGLALTRRNSSVQLMNGYEDRDTQPGGVVLKLRHIPVPPNAWQGCFRARGFSRTHGSSASVDDQDGFHGSTAGRPKVMRLLEGQRRVIAGAFSERIKSGTCTPGRLWLNHAACCWMKVGARVRPSRCHVATRRGKK